MSRLTRDGTTEPISRNHILRREREQKNIHFSCTTGGTFMAKRIAAKKARAGLRHAVGCPNVTGKDRGEDRPKQAGSCWFARHSLASHKWRELVSSGRLVCRCHVGLALVLRLFCFASFFVFMISLKPRPFAQSFFVFRYACVPTATRVSFFFQFFF